MSFYDAFKDVLNVAQKADNIDLYRQLLDLSALALDMQSEINKLKEENDELRKKQDIANQIIRHVEPCITIKDEEPILYYCSHCWDSAGLLIQLNCHSNGTFDCSHCGAKGNYDNEKKVKSDKEQLKVISQIGKTRY